MNSTKKQVPLKPVETTAPTVADAAETSTDSH